MPTTSPGIWFLAMTAAAASSTAPFRTSCGTPAHPAPIDAPSRPQAVAAAAIVRNCIAPQALRNELRNRKSVGVDLQLLGNEVCIGIWIVMVVAGSVHREELNEAHGRLVVG